MGDCDSDYDQIQHKNVHISLSFDNDYITVHREILMALPFKKLGEGDLKKLLTTHPLGFNFTLHIHFVESLLDHLQVPPS